MTSEGLRGFGMINTRSIMGTLQTKPARKAPRGPIPNINVRNHCRWWTLYISYMGIGLLSGSVTCSLNSAMAKNA
jgi:hypothetical protein